MRVAIPAAMVTGNRYARIASGADRRKMSHDESTSPSSTRTLAAPRPGNAAIPMYVTVAVPISLRPLLGRSAAHQTATAKTKSRVALVNGAVSAYPVRPGGQAGWGKNEA